MAAAFNDPWYAETIDRFTQETGEHGLDGLGRCILAASCIIAQSIDDLTKAMEKVALNIEDLASEQDRPAGTDTDGH